MKLLALAASNSTESINRQLVTHAAHLLEGGLIDDVSTELLDLNDYEMPIYSPEREASGGVPQLAQDLFAKIGAADALLLSFAEHNGTYTAAYKNVLDWVSRIDMRLFQDKPTVMLATSPGPGGAGNVLQAAVGAAPFAGGDLRGSLSVPSFYENFDAANGTLTNPELATELRSVLSALS